MSTSSSILNRTATLGELADVDALNEVCDRFQESFDLSVAIFEADGKTIVPPAVNPSNPGRAHDFTAAVEVYVSSGSPGNDPASIELHASGTRYLAVPIHNDLDPVGVAIVGPFRHEAGADDLPVLKAEEADNLGRFLGGMLDVLVFTSYKSFLTAKVHMESMEDSFRELEAKAEELRQSYEKLKELDRLKSNFLSTVSHELRTPLTSIIGYSEMLADGLAGKLPDKAQKQVEIIVEKGEVLLHLINNVLDLSKIESGGMTMAVDEVNLPELFSIAVETVRPQASKRKIELAVDLGEGVERIWADKAKVRQILVNLLSNSVKFTPQGRVTLSARARDYDEVAGVEIQVADTGIGIPREKLNRIFEHFYQVDNTSTREHDGTGLGLPIVKSFVEMHGGRIYADSEEGKGTTMRVWLPSEARPAAG